jgi:hypothetical protein
MGQGMGQGMPKSNHRRCATIRLGGLGGWATICLDPFGHIECRSFSNQFASHIGCFSEALLMSAHAEALLIALLMSAHATHVSNAHV